MIDKKHKHLSIRRQTMLLKINRGMLYYEESDKTANFILSNMIAEIYAQHPIYGYRRITSILEREKNIIANRKKSSKIDERDEFVCYLPKAKHK